MGSGLSKYLLTLLAVNPAAHRHGSVNGKTNKVASSQSETGGVRASAQDEGAKDANIDDLVSIVKEETTEEQPEREAQTGFDQDRVTS